LVPNHLAGLIKYLTSKEFLKLNGKGANLSVRPFV